MNQKISIPLFILAIGYLLATWLLPKYEYILIDADIFPLLLGGLLALFSVILFFSKDEEGAKIYIAKDDLKVIVPVVLLMLLYILLLEPVGFVITTVCFIFICSLLLGYKKTCNKRHCCRTLSSGFLLFVYTLFNDCFAEWYIANLMVRKELPYGRL